jgi:long-chain acyl-CoA synthetase
MTLPARLLELAATRPDAVAFRRKRLGLWEETTYADYARRVAAVGLGLLELGVGPGDRVAIQSDNRPEWLLADLAAQGIGAISVGVYASSPEAEVAHVLSNSGAVVVVVEDEEQLDKVLAVRPRVPALRHVVVMDPPRRLGADDARTFADLEALGGDAPLPVFAERVAALDDGAAAAFVYTSGTTGPPKGAMVSHANLEAAAGASGALGGPVAGDELLSYLPLSHIAERLLSTADALRAEAVVNFGEGGESFPADLREVQPTVFLGVPVVWEKLLAGVEIRMADATRFKRAMYRVWVAQGRRRAAARMSDDLGLVDRVVLGVGWLVLYRSLRAKLGLGRVRVALSGAAPISPAVLEWFWAIGVPVREVYGQTENTAMATCARLGEVHLGTVGRALDGVDLRLDEDGEVLVRSAGTFLGYHADAAATTEVLDAEGWLHTGDIGVLDPDGNLTITDRKKDIIVTAGGKNVAPSLVENQLKVSPYVRDAIVIGDRRPFVTALLGVDAVAVGDWARRRGHAFLTLEELVALPDVIELLGGVVDAVNVELASSEAVRQFRLLPDELDQEGGALTATQKVKRSAVAEQYRDLIDSMYAGVAA